MPKKLRGSGQGPRVNVVGQNFDSDPTKTIQSGNNTFMLNGISLFDCTIREVGYQTGWFFDPSFLRDYYRFLAAVGFDYMEIGFFHNEEADPCRGPCRYCSTQVEELRAFFHSTKNLLKLSAMRDIQRPLAPIGKASESVVDAIRILTRSQETDFDILSRHIDELQELGYELFINFTSAGRNSPEQNLSFAKFAAKKGLSVIYFADTESIFTGKYVADVIEICRSERIEAGIHLHNRNGTAEDLLNIALAHKCKFIDSTLLGLGGKWHDGNISTEVILRHFNCSPGYELTRLKTILIQQLIKYHQCSAAVWE